MLSDFDALVSGKLDAKVRLALGQLVSLSPQKLLRRLLCGVAALADAGLILINGLSSGRSYSLQPSVTIISLVPAVEQVQALFMDGGPVKVSARVRDAVLHPLLPLLRRLPIAET